MNDTKWTAKTTCAPYGLLFFRNSEVIPQIAHYGNFAIVREGVYFEASPPGGEIGLRSLFAPFARGATIDFLSFAPAGKNHHCLETHRVRRPRARRHTGWTHAAVRPDGRLQRGPAAGRERAIGRMRRANRDATLAEHDLVQPVERHNSCRSELVRGIEAPSTDSVALSLSYGHPRFQFFKPVEHDLNLRICARAGLAFVREGASHELAGRCDVVGPSLLRRGQLEWSGHR
jgi:hypothetical protein